MSGGTTVRYYSVDKAGNTEKPKEIVASGSDETPPDTAIDSGPSGVVNGKSANFTFSSTEPGSTFECKLDNAAYEKCSSPKSYANLSDGSHTFQVKAIDVADNVDPTPARRTWTIDATTPSVTPATMSFINPPSQIGTSTVPVKVLWSGKDNGSGIVRYELQQAINDGAYYAVSLPTPMASSITRSFVADKIYRFRVRAQDKAGNWSTWMQSSFSLRDNNELIRTNVPWTQVAGTSYSSYYESNVRYHNATGSYAYLDFTGRDVAWIAHKAPNRGKAEVWIDGAKVATVDLYSSTTQLRQVVFRKYWASSGGHTIQVKLLGTKNSSSTGTRVDIDDIITIK